MSEDEDDTYEDDEEEAAPVSSSVVRDLPCPLGPYVLKERLGMGGMAEVFVATEPGGPVPEREIVIKRVLPHLARNKKYLAMFEREGRIAQRFDHPNVVACFDVGEADGAHYIALEYVHGLTLRRLAKRAWSRKRPIPVDVLAQIIADAATGLHHVHELPDEHGEVHRFVHRDISPDNLIVGTSGIAKVLDFGIAKPGNEEDPLTRTGELKGKIPYMPPEQVEGKDLDGRSDLYSLGVTLYWALTRRRPFDRTSELLTLNAILNEPPAAPKPYKLELELELRNVLKKLLQKDPNHRYQTGDELAEALRQWVPPSRERVGAFVREMMQPLGGEELSEPGRAVGGGVPTGIQTQRTVEVKDPGGSHLPTRAARGGASRGGGPRTGPASEPGDSALVPVRRRTTLLAAASGGLAAVALLGVGLAALFLPRGAGTLSDPGAPPPLSAHVGEGPAGGGTPALPPAEQATDEPGPDEEPTRDRPEASETPAGDRPASAAGERTPRPTKRTGSRGPRTRGADVAPATRKVPVKGPAYVRWTLPDGTSLGRGTGGIELPAGEAQVIAVDTRTGLRTRVKAEPGLDYDKLPRGKLTFRVAPYAKVFLGKKSFGTTPFDDLELVAGSVKVTLIFEDQEEVRTVEIPAGGQARVKHSFQQ